jgi:hypothetical protein
MHDSGEARNALEKEPLIDIEPSGKDDAEAGSDIRTLPPNDVQSLEQWPRIASSQSGELTCVDEVHPSRV